jgi:hypothetical protein
MPMCAPFPVMPRSDPKNGPAAGMVMNVDPPCEKPIPAASTDEQVMRETIRLMDRHNIIGMVSGEPELMRVWRAAAPPELDLCISEQAGPAPRLEVADDFADYIDARMIAGSAVDAHLSRRAE